MLLVESGMEHLDWNFWGADLSVKTDSTDSTDKNETVLSVTVIGTPNRQKKLSASLAKTF